MLTVSSNSRAKGLLLSTLQSLTLSDNYRAQEACSAFAGANWLNGGETDYAMKSKPPIKREETHMHVISRIFMSQRTKRGTFPAIVELASESKGGPSQDPSQDQEAYSLSFLPAFHESFTSLV